MKRSLPRAANWVVTRPGTVAVAVMLALLSLVFVPDLSRRFPVLSAYRVDSAFWETPDRIGWVVTFCRHRADAIPERVTWEWVYQTGEAVERLYGVRRIDADGGPGKDLSDGETLEALRPQCEPPHRRRFSSEVPRNGAGGDRLRGTMYYRPLWGHAWWLDEAPFGYIRVPERPDEHAIRSEITRRLYMQAQPQLRALEHRGYDQSARSR